MLAKEELRLDFQQPYRSRKPEAFALLERRDFFDFDEYFARPNQFYEKVASIAPANATHWRLTTASSEPIVQYTENGARCSVEFWRER